MLQVASFHYNSRNATTGMVMGVSSYGTVVTLIDDYLIGNYGDLGRSVCTLQKPGEEPAEACVLHVAETDLDAYAASASAAGSDEPTEFTTTFGPM